MELMPDRSIDRLDPELSHARRLLSRWTARSSELAFFLMRVSWPTLWPTGYWLPIFLGPASLVLLMVYGIMTRQYAAFLILATLSLFVGVEILRPRHGHGGASNESAAVA